MDEESEGRIRASLLWSSANKGSRIQIFSSFLLCLISTPCSTCKVRDIPPIKKLVLDHFFFPFFFLTLIWHAYLFGMLLRSSGPLIIQLQSPLAILDLAIADPLLYRMTQRQLSSRYTGQLCDGGSAGVSSPELFFAVPDGPVNSPVHIDTLHFSLL